MGRFARSSSPAGAPIVNLPCGTTTISGQPFEQSRNDVPGAGVCRQPTIISAPVVAAKNESEEAARHIDKTILLINFFLAVVIYCYSANIALPASAPARIVTGNSIR